MARGNTKVRDLAKEASLDVDETLVELWDAGLDYILGPEDFIRAGDANRAKRAIGLATRRDMIDPGYWRAVFRVNHREWNELLESLGLTPRKFARTVGRKAVTRLKAEARRRNIDPMTGATVSVPAVESSRQEAGSGLEKTEWKCTGHQRDIRWLTVNEVRGIHLAIAADFENTNDPIRPVGVRSEDLLASAVFRPQTALGGTLKYDTVEASAAALLSSLIHDHPFINGNKRTALVSMLVFLDENGFTATCHEDELFKLVLQAAQHRIAEGTSRNLSDNEVLAINGWLVDRTRGIELGDHPIPFRKLRRVLVSFGCELTSPGSNRINISRNVTKRTLFGRKRSVPIRTQVHYKSEGREVGKQTLKKIREDLHLDEEHGVDSRDFYGADGGSVTDFIATYRKTLGRLAKL